MKFWETVLPHRGAKIYVADIDVVSFGTLHDVVSLSLYIYIYMYIMSRGSIASVRPWWFYNWGANELDMINWSLTFGQGTAYDDHPLRLRREDPSKSSATTNLPVKVWAKAMPLSHDVVGSVDVCWTEFHPMYPSWQCQHSDWTRVVRESPLSSGLGIPSVWSYPYLQCLLSSDAAAAPLLPLEYKMWNLSACSAGCRVSGIEGVLCQRLSVSLLPAVSWTPEHDCPGPSDE